MQQIIINNSIDLFKKIIAINESIDTKNSRELLQCLHFKKIDNNILLIEAVSFKTASRAVIECEKIEIDDIIIKNIDIIDIAKKESKNKFATPAIIEDNADKIILNNQYIINKYKDEYINIDNICNQYENANNNNIYLSVDVLSVLIKQAKTLGGVIHLNAPNNNNKPLFYEIITKNSADIKGVIIQLRR